MTYQEQVLHLLKQIRNELRILNHGNAQKKVEIPKVQDIKPLKKLASRNRADGSTEWYEVKE